MNDERLTIRIATAHDVENLRRLAALDSAPPPRGRVLLAELDSTPVAAVAIYSGSVTADPFQSTAEAVRLLRLRRYQLLRQGGDVAGGRSLIRRLVPGGAR